MMTDTNNAARERFEDACRPSRPGTGIMKTQPITVRGETFPTVGEAMQYADASGFGDAVLSVKGVAGYLLTTKADADRLDAAGRITAHWFDYRGQIVSVPA